MGKKWYITIIVLVITGMIFYGLNQIRTTQEKEENPIDVYIYENYGKKVWAEEFKSDRVRYPLIQNVHYESEIENDYTYVWYEGKCYLNNHTPLLAISKKLGTIEMEGYEDSDKSVKSLHNIYSIQDVTAEYAIAVEFNGVYYCFSATEVVKNKEGEFQEEQIYVPKTLGQLINDIGMKKQLRFDGQEGYAEEYIEKKTFIKKENWAENYRIINFRMESDFMWETLLNQTDAKCLGGSIVGESHENAHIIIHGMLEHLNQEISFEFTSKEEMLITIGNIVEYKFDMNKDGIYQCIQYINEKLEGKEE